MEKVEIFRNLTMAEAIASAHCKPFHLCFTRDTHDVVFEGKIYNRRKEIPLCKINSMVEGKTLDEIRAITGMYLIIDEERKQTGMMLMYLGEDAQTVTQLVVSLNTASKLPSAEYRTAPIYRSEGGAWSGWQPLLYAQGITPEEAASTLSNMLAEEIATRIASDATIAADLASEVTRATAAENAIATDLNTETATRIQAVTLEKEAREDADKDLAADAHKTYPTRIEKLADFAYSAHYDTVNYEEAKKYFASNYEVNIGACSAFWKDGVLYRNYDWYYSNNAGFLVRTPAGNGRHAVVGAAGYINGLTDDVVESGAHNEKYSILPFLMTDGMNDAGLSAAVLVCENKDVTPTAQNTGKKKMNGLFIVRYVLDNHTDAHEAAQDIANNYDVYMPHTDSVDEELHFIIGDKEKCVILEFVDNVTKIIPDRNFVTNFKLFGTTHNADGTIDYTTVRPYGQGIERYNIIASQYDSIYPVSGKLLLEALKYTNAYNSPSANSWRTEFTGVADDLTVAAAFETPAKYNSVISDARELYLARTRESQKTWQTCHSVVYDANTMSLAGWVQEDSTRIAQKSITISLEDEIAAREAADAGLQAQIGDLDDLDTTAKDNVVEAVNEVAGRVDYTQTALNDERTDRTTADAALWTAVNNKVDKVAGKGLSTNDYTNEEKSKVANAATLDEAKGKGVSANDFPARNYVFNTPGKTSVEELNELLDGVGEGEYDRSMNGILLTVVGGCRVQIYNLNVQQGTHQKYLQIVVSALGITEDGKSLTYQTDKNLNSNCILTRQHDEINGWQPWKPLHQEIVGKLGDLTTTDKSSIVAAINEASGNNKKILFGRNMYPEEFAFRDGSHVLDASGKWKTGKSTFIFKITRKHDRVRETYGRAFICDGWNEVGLINPVSFSNSKELTDGDVGKYVAVCHTSGYNGPMYSVYSENVWFEDLLSEKEYKNELDKIHALYRPNEYKFNALNSTTNTIYVSPLKLMHGNNIRNIMSGCDDELGNMAWPYMISTAEKLEHANQCNLLLREFRANYPITGVTSLYNCFAGCVYLESLDLSGWDTSAVTTMDYMFYGCSSLTSLDLSGWDTSAVTTMRLMFSGCSSLTSLDLSGWDTSAVTTMYYMFSGCSSLTSLIGGSQDTTKTCFNSLAVNLDLSPTNIDRASILAVFNGLADMSGQTAPTITLGNTLKAKLTNADKAIAIVKNWNIA